MQIIGFSLEIGQEKLKAISGEVAVGVGAVAGINKFTLDSQTRKFEKIIGALTQRIAAVEKTVPAVDSNVMIGTVIVIIAVLFLLVAILLFVLFFVVIKLQ